MTLPRRTMLATALKGLAVGALAPGLLAVQAAESAAATLPSSAADDIEEMLRSTIILCAKDLVGVWPYTWGGGHAAKPGPSKGTNGVKGFDCSGYVRYVMYQAGFGDFPLVAEGFRTTSRLFRNIPKAARARGDIILFGDPGHATHVAIYAGTKSGVPMMYEAATTKLDTSYNPVSRRSDILGYRTLF